MKKITFAFLFASILFGCSMNNDNSEKNIALIEKYIQSVEDLNYTAMDLVLDDNYIGLGPSHNDKIDKIQTIKNWKYNVENLYESIDYSKSRNIATHIDSGENQGDWIANWSEMNIVYKKDKAAVTIWASTSYLIKNNKIIKSYTIYNEADVLEQLGYVFINPNDL